MDYNLNILTQFIIESCQKFQTVDDDVLLGMIQIESIKKTIKMQ